MRWPPWTWRPGTASARSPRCQVQGSPLSLLATPAGREPAETRLSAACRGDQRNPADDRDGAEHDPGAITGHETARGEGQIQSLGDPDRPAEGDHEAKQGSDGAHSLPRIARPN